MTAITQDQKLVDLWLKKGLSAYYAAVLREPLPAEWVTLLRYPGGE